MAMPGVLCSVQNLVTICVDRCGNGFGGEAWHCYADEPLRFSSPDEMVLQLDRLFDRLSLPQAENWFRCFSGGKRHGFLRPVTGAMPLKKLDQREILQRTGACATFVLHVQYRQNCTWQGSLIWVEGESRMQFRSVLELLKIMDHVLTRGAMPLREADVSQPDGEPVTA